MTSSSLDCAREPPCAAGGTIRFVGGLVVELIQPRLVGPPDNAGDPGRHAKDFARLRAKEAGERVENGHEEYLPAARGRARGRRARTAGLKVGGARGLPAAIAPRDAV